MKNMRHLAETHAPPKAAHAGEITFGMDGYNFNSAPGKHKHLVVRQQTEH
jgi:hypothetical protein